VGDPHDLTFSDSDDDVQILEPSNSTSGSSSSSSSTTSTSGGGGARPLKYVASTTAAVKGESSITCSSNSNSTPFLPLLPFYLNTVRGLSTHYNELCLGLEDVFSGDYHKAILCNYMYDMAFMFDVIPRLTSIPWLCVFGDNPESTGVVGRQFPNIATFKPKLKGTPFTWGTHHSKMALLWYNGGGMGEGRRGGGLRMMVCTANFIEVDWRNKTQGVWVQDFPCLEEGERDDESEFGKELRDYLLALNGFENEGGEGQGED